VHVSRQAGQHLGQQRATYTGQGARGLRQQGDGFGVRQAGRCAEIMNPERSPGKALRVTASSRKRRGLAEDCAGRCGVARANLSIGETQQQGGPVSGSSQAAGVQDAQRAVVVADGVVRREPIDRVFGCPATPGDGFPDGCRAARRGGEPVPGDLGRVDRHSRTGQVGQHLSAT